MSHLHGLRSVDAPESFFDCLQLIASEDREWVQQTMLQAAQTAEDFRVEYRVGLPDGTTRTLECMGSAATRGEGRQMVGLCHDLTQHRQQSRGPQEEIATPPLLPVDFRVLLCPLVGMIDRQRAAHIAERLSFEVHRNGVRAVVMDMTGVSAITPTALNELIDMVESIRLLGAESILTGISPSMARALIDMYGNMERMIIERDVQEGIRHARSLLLAS